MVFLVEYAVDRVGQVKLEEFDLTMTLSAQELAHLISNPTGFLRAHLERSGLEVDDVFFHGFDQVAVPPVKVGEFKGMVPLVFKVWHTDSGPHSSRFNVLIGASPKGEAKLGLERVGESMVDEFRSKIDLASVDISGLVAMPAEFFRQWLQSAAGLDVKAVYFVRSDQQLNSDERGGSVNPVDESFGPVHWIQSKPSVYFVWVEA